ncbi:hypothetical protein FAGAP_1041 [Fusarium agapanthi]|uniref:F-box domain-containing protein n=1 Tax=Fusarium agapanthi TaxID=1803897 RepID=A0A9P5BJ17_9HYPO|nr:hypothetical protein FAGAP_1041 [Fusarium agapanthi]
MPSLTSLPLEMLGEVGRHLQVQDLKRCSLTCKVLEAEMRMHLFRKLAFVGTRSAMAEVLMRFLANVNQSRTQGMSRACRYLQIEVLPTDIDSFHECRDLLPALILSAKRNLPRVTTLSLTLHGLSKPEVSSLHRMVKETPSWDSVTILISDVRPVTLSMLLRHSMVNVRTIDVIPSMGRQDVASIKESCPGVRELRVNLKSPFSDFLKHLRGSWRAKINQLDNLEQLVIQEKGPAETFPIGGIPRPVDIPHRLSLIAGQLRGLSSLRQLSIEFHPRIMHWILPTRRLIPGHHLRTDLDTFLMRAIMEMGALLPQVEEICLVERSAVFNGVNLIHRGVRDSGGVMAVTIEAPGDENDFPLNLSR